ncbi:hypothetical protein [Dietzia natronolimnaea]|uniref:hypothetical protein n=1 Tax=Dietzia natronolimnaea TaxID=161920 RepID=UPI001140F72A|nr:hypothetical protein [Dietzia natronolimnaea]
MTTATRSTRIPDHHAPATPPAAPEAHHHRWVHRSAHRTSEGTVTYESCHCGAHRVVRAGMPVARVAGTPPTRATGT